MRIHAREFASVRIYIYARAKTVYFVYRGFCMYENERNVELYFRRQVKRVLHGRAYKFVSPGSDGVPDRIAIIPCKGGEALVRFVELKRPGGRLRQIQILRQAEMRMLGAVCRTLDSKESIDTWVREMQEAQQK